MMPSTVTDLHFAVTGKPVTVGASTLADERAYFSDPLTVFV